MRSPRPASLAADRERASIPRTSVDRPAGRSSRLGPTIVAAAKRRRGGGAPIARVDQRGLGPECPADGRDPIRRQLVAAENEGFGRCRQLALARRPCGRPPSSGRAEFSRPQLATPPARVHASHPRAQGAPESAPVVLTQADLGRELHRPIEPYLERHRRARGLDQRATLNSLDSPTGHAAVADPRSRPIQRRQHNKAARNGAESLLPGARSRHPPWDRQAGIVRRCRHSR